MPRRQLLQRLAALGLPGALLAACSKSPDEGPARASSATPPTPAEAYQLASGGHGFTVGAMMAANTVYVFFDTTCPHCAQLWQASQPLLNRVKLVWMPVALLRPQSGPQGATILGAPDPVAAMNENEAKVRDRSGGITANPSVSDEVKARVQANTDIFRKLGADSVPLIVYKNAKTGLPGTHAGALDTAGLATLLGL